MIGVLGMGLLTTWKCHCYVQNVHYKIFTCFVFWRCPFCSYFCCDGVCVNQTKRNLPYSLSLFLPLSEIINVWLLCRRFIVGWLVWHFCVSHSKSCYHILAISWFSFRRLLSSVWSDNVKSNKRYSSNARICSILLCHSLTCVENVHFQIDGLERENNQKIYIMFW